MFLDVLYVKTFFSQQLVVLLVIFNKSIACCSWTSIHTVKFQSSYSNSAGDKDLFRTNSSLVHLFVTSRQIRLLADLKFESKVCMYKTTIQDVCTVDCDCGIWLWWIDVEEEMCNWEEGWKCQKSEDACVLNNEAKFQFLFFFSCRLSCTQSGSHYITEVQNL